MIAAFLAWLQGFTPAATGIWLFGSSGALVWFVSIMRERRLDRKLSIDDREARRAGFTAQLTQYQTTQGELMKAQTELRREYDEYRRACQTETALLRSQIIQLENDVAGWKRRFDTLVGYVSRKWGDIPAELIEHVQTVVSSRST